MSILDGYLEPSQIERLRSQLWDDVRRLLEFADAGGREAPHFKRAALTLIEICGRLGLSDPKKTQRIAELREQLAADNRKKQEYEQGEQAYGAGTRVE